MAADRSVRAPIASPVMQFALFGVGCVALWVPTIFWLASPDRTTVLGDSGRMLLYGTVMIQIVALGVGLFLVAVQWDGRTARALSRGLGAIGWLVGLVWAYWVVLMLDLPDGDYLALAGVAVLLMVPAILPLRHSRVRSGAGLVAIVAVVAVSIALWFTQFSAILIAPATVYGVAVMTSRSALRGVD